MNDAKGQPMWEAVWYALGKATGFTVTSVAAVPGREDSTGRMGRPMNRRNGVAAFLALTAGHLCGAASHQKRRALLACSGIRASFSGLVQMVAGRHRPFPSIQAVQEQAERIALLLGERGGVPNRLGIDGVPGSGKSSLARALAARLDMQWSSLDYRNVGLPGTLEQERTIYEHHRLLRTQEVDAFDAIIYIDEPVERSKSKVIRRGRGLILAAILDYHTLKKVGEMAFDVCEGEPISVPNSPLVLKIKPAGGFRAIENIADRLRAAGLAPSDMVKEEMLFLLACGKRQHGLKAYLSPFACIAGLGGLAAGLFWAGRTRASGSRVTVPASLQGGVSLAAGG